MSQQNDQPGQTGKDALTEQQIREQKQREQQQEQPENQPSHPDDVAKP